MTDENKNTQFIRWYDKHETVSRGMITLENVPDEFKRRVATYLIDEVIDKKPYCDMFPVDTHYLIISESRRRRWYDFDETVRIFIELLRHSSEGQQIEICAKVLEFLDSLGVNRTE